MDNSLLCPAQLRANDVILDECPKSMTDNPTSDTHTMQGTLDDNTPCKIHFNLRGVTSYINVTKPTVEEFNNLAKFELSSATTEWDPSSENFAAAEAAMLSPDGALSPGGGRKLFTAHSVTTKSPYKASLVKLQAIAQRHCRCAAVLSSIAPYYNDEYLGAKLRKDLQASMTTTSNRKSGLTAEKLARTWKISLRRAENTINATTQRGSMTIANPAISRRFRSNDRALRYNRIHHDMYTDTFIAKVKSKRQNKYAQVYATDFGWSRSYPMKKKGDAHHTLQELFRIGVPIKMTMDGSKEQTLGDFRKKLREVDCKVHQIEKDSPFANTAEAEIREIKKGSGRKMTAKHSPMKLWDRCLQLESLIRSHTALDVYKLDGQVPETILTGYTADISQLYEFEWYEFIKYYESAARYPEDKMVLGRYLGPAMDVGPHLTAIVLKMNSEETYCSTYQKLTQDELDDETEKEMRIEFDKMINLKLGPETSNEDLIEIGAETNEVPYYFDETTNPNLTPDRDEYQTFDTFIGADVRLPYEGEYLTAHVKRRVRLKDGTLKGTANDQPLFDTRAYIVEFPSGIEAEYTANCIAENLLSQCDIDGHEYQYVKGFRDHKKDKTALTKQNCYVNDDAGRKHQIKSTKGWKILTEFKDGTTSWTRLADLKESNPVELADYAVAHELQDEPAFSWWVPYTLQKRQRIVAAVNSRYHKRTHKYGFEIPKSVEDAERIDQQNGDHR